jgi:prolyl oligopeptidase
MTLRAISRFFTMMFAIFSLFTAVKATAAAEPRIEYPRSKRSEQVDVLHGVKVPDPYRWLETDVRESKEVADWVEAENVVTDRFLDAIPQREAIRARLTELWNYARYSSPRKEGGRYYYLKNDGLQPQAVLYVLDALDAKPRVLIDPNTWSKDGTIALADTAYSDDGKYMAYCAAEAGSDWQTWRVLEITSGKLLDDQIKWTKFAGASWTKDGKGFFYGRFPEPQPGAAFQALNLNHKIYYHRVGASQSDDVLVYARGDHPDWTFEPEVTEDGRYLVITTARNTDDKYRITVKDLTEPYGMPIELIDNFDNEYAFVGNDGPIFYFKTDLDASRKRLIAIDLNDPRREKYREIIPQAEEALLGVSYVSNLFVASYLKDVRPQVKIFEPSGQFVREVEFPALGCASGFAGYRKDTETFYDFSSYVAAPAIYHFDIITGKSTVFRRAEVKFKADDYEMKQVFYRSKDGTRVPMFVAHKKGLKLDGTNPTLLYGYGGFNITTEPRFSVRWVQWMEMGGVFASANLRGGGEYGEAWHLAGKLDKKQNVFDDFIAAAEWLVENKYTQPQKMAIMGGSNGGLLVGAVMTQRPDLFGACLPAVGVMDMLRYQKFTAGRMWVSEYGMADDPKEFKTLLAYSPYHNLKPGTRYPATLITTADTDDRVVPAHSFKFAAALQHEQAGPAPVLIRIETRAGHGAGKPTAKAIDELTDQWAFLVKVLGVKMP